MKKNFYFSFMYLVVAMQSSVYLQAEPMMLTTAPPHQTSKTIVDKLSQYQNDKVEMELRIKHAELEIQRLLAISHPEEQFDAQNSIIGMKYELKSMMDELKNINATILILRNSDNVSNNGQDFKADAVLTKQQKALIKQSYTMKPAEAALNLAMAKALEPMKEAPVLGEAPMLASFFPRTSVTRDNGVMRHIGGNQYKLEAYLRPGKQEFIIGSMRFIKTVPIDFDAVICIVLLDASDIKKPVLEYFIQ